MLTSYGEGNVLIDAGGQIVASSANLTAVFGRDGQYMGAFGIDPSTGQSAYWTSTGAEQTGLTESQVNAWVTWAQQQSTSGQLSFISGPIDPTVDDTDEEGFSVQDADGAQFYVSNEVTVAYDGYSSYNADDIDQLMEQDEAQEAVDGDTGDDGDPYDAAMGTVPSQTEADGVGPDDETSLREIVGNDLNNLTDNGLYPGEPNGDDAFADIYSDVISNGYRVTGTYDVPNGEAMTVVDPDNPAYTFTISASNSAVDISVDWYGNEVTDFELQNIETGPGFAMDGQNWYVAWREAGMPQGAWIPWKTVPGSELGPEPQ